MMIDATVAPKVGFISPFGTTVCNVNHINAAGQARQTAGARDERTLFAVACSRLLELTGRSDQRLPCTPAADEDECHKGRLGERVTPAVTGSVLNDTVSLPKMNRLTVIEFEDDFAADYNAVVNAVGCMHSRRISLKVTGHAGNLLIKLLEVLRGYPETALGTT